MKSLIMILFVLILHGCTVEDVCNEYYIYDYEYIELDDGSIIAGAPIYRCRR